MLDLAAAGHQYKLNLYAEDSAGSRRLLESHDNTDTHSVDDYAVASKSGGTSKRQVYGWDAFMNHRYVYMEQTAPRVFERPFKRTTQHIFTMYLMPPVDV